MDTNNVHCGDLQCTETNQQIQRIDGDGVEPNHQKEITDLIQEFLEQIFMHLDFTSLVRAADVCNQFREATKWPFKQNYARKSIELAMAPDQSELYHEKDGHLTIADLKLGMSTLRCFSGSITQLKLMNPNTMAAANKIYKYCVDGEFPQLRCLSIDTMFGAEFAAKAMPNLQELSMDLSQSGIEGGNLVSALQLNPQLRKFKIQLNDEFYSSFVNDCIPHLQCIEEFHLTCKSKIFHHFCPFGNEAESYLKLHLPSVRIFKLYLDTTYKGNELPYIPFQFSQLKSFSLRGEYHPSDAFIDFIERHPTITSLSFKNTSRVTGYFLRFTYMPILPLLEELIVLPCDVLTMKIDYLIYLTRKFSSFNRCMFYCRNPKSSKLNTEEDGFNTKWNVHVISERHHKVPAVVELIRKM